MASTKIPVELSSTPGIVDNSNATAITINSSESVGIGTGSPQNTLHVNGTLRVGPYYAVSDRDHFLVTPGGSVTTVSTPNENANYDNSAGNIHIRTNSGYNTPVERLTVTSAGNVGIGTTSPRATFDVRGGHSSSINEAISFGRTDDDYRYNSIFSRNTSSTGSYLSFKIHDGGSSTAQTETLVIGPGKVGINTTSPAKQLHVYQPSGQTGILLSRANNITGVNLQFSVDSSKTRLISYGDGLTFWTNSAGDGTNASERIRITNAGNLGIGTTSPSEKLEVAGNVKSAGLKLDVNTSMYTQNATLSYYSSTNAVYLNGAGNNGWLRINASGTQNDGVAINLFGSNAGNLITLKTNTAERMRIDSEGNVGIGTASPSSFHANAKNLVVGSGSGAEGITIYSGNATYGVIYFADGTSGSAAYAGNIQYNHSDNSLRLGANGSTTDFAIGSSGNVGIGTTSPSSQLQITGAAGSSTNRIKFTNADGANIQIGKHAGTDNDAEFGTYTANGLKLITNSTDRITITDAGKVGIGTNSPAAPLHVLKSDNDVTLLHLNHSSANSGTADYGHYGELLIQGSTHCKSGIRAYSNGYQTANSALTFFTSQHGGSYAERMRIMGDGKVGIGTSSPQGLIDLTVSQAKTTTSGATFAQLGKTNESSNYAALQCEVKGGASAADRKWEFQTIEQGVANAGSIVFQLNGGNIGIGTASPNAKLDILGTTSDQLRLRTAESEEYKIGRNSSTGHLDFYGTQSGYTGYTFGGVDGERMRINSTGEVHITSAGAAISPTIKHSGTTGDVAKLRLINRSGQSSNKGGLVEMGAITNDAVTRSDVFASVAGLKDNAISGNKAGYMQFSTSNGSTLAEKMRLNSNGTLMVGTATDPTYPHRLYASGNAITNGTVFFEDTDVSCGLANVVMKLSFSNDNDATNASFIYMTDGNSVLGTVGVASGTSINFSSASDERMKKNIVDASPQLNNIKNVKVREFDWKKNDHHELGLIAQEVNTIFPDVVKEGSDDETEHPWSVDYGKLTPYLIKAVQEQQTIIEDLKSRIEILEG